MIGIVLVSVFSTKVVNDKAEGAVSCIIPPEARIDMSIMILKWGQCYNQLMVSQLASLRTVIHATT
jgi:hypothetical protein